MEQFSWEAKQKLREKFEDRWNKVANELYSASITEILNKWDRYKDENAIIKDAIQCINLLLVRIDNFASILLPNFKDNSFENLIDDGLLAKIIKNVREDWESKLKNALLEINGKRFFKSFQQVFDILSCMCKGKVLAELSLCSLYAVFFGWAATVKAFKEKGSAMANITSWISLICQFVSVKLFFDDKKNNVLSENAWLSFLWNLIDKNESMATFVDKLYERQYQQYENKKGPPRLKINEFEVNYSLSECEINYIQ